MTAAGIAGRAADVRNSSFKKGESVALLSLVEVGMVYRTSVEGSLR